MLQVLIFTWWVWNTGLHVTTTKQQKLPQSCIFYVWKELFQIPTSQFPTGPRHFHRPHLCESPLHIAHASQLPNVPVPYIITAGESFHIAYPSSLLLALLFSWLRSHTARTQNSARGLSSPDYPHSSACWWEPRNNKFDTLLVVFSPHNDITLTISHGVI